MKVALIFTFALALVQSYSLDYKQDKINLHLAKSSVVELNDQLFKALTEDPRNYSLVLLATAMDPKIGCEPCRKFDSEFRLVASSAQPSRDVIFAIADYSNAKGAFSALGLSSAPNVFHFPATGDKEQWDMSSLDAEALQSWVQVTTGKSFTIKRPFDYSQLVFYLTMGLFVGAAAKIVLSKFHTIITNPMLWALISLLFIIHMSSGYMWNVIRGAPYAGRGQNGKMEIIMPQFSSQYQIESQIVTTIYAVLAACVVFLVNRVPKISSVNGQRAAVFISLGIFLATYSFLIAVFRLKNGGYPFKLLF